jgi:hypothetical protein
MNKLNKIKCVNEDQPKVYKIKYFNVPTLQRFVCESSMNHTKIGHNV